jgi:hypothetical protein
MESQGNAAAAAETTAAGGEEGEGRRRGVWRFEVDGARDDEAANCDGLMAPVLD